MRFSGVPSGEKVVNLLLPAEQQHEEWLQLNSVTLIHYSIIHTWMCLRSNNTGQTVKQFSDFLSTTWGVHSRKETGEKRKLNQIPVIQTARDTIEKNNSGSRFVLSEKRLMDAIVLATSIMVLNDNFDVQPQCGSSNNAVSSLFLYPCPNVR